MVIVSYYKQTISLKKTIMIDLPDFKKTFDPKNNFLSFV